MASTTTSSSLWTRPSIIALISVSALATGMLGYALYFDHRRRTDPQFRRALKRDARKTARAAQQEAEAEQSQRRRMIREAVDEVNEEDLPTDPEEVEKFFLDMVAQGEVLCSDQSKLMDAAGCFFRALKVYPQQDDLIGIYDKTVPRPVLDILAEMIATDPQINYRQRAFRPTGSDGAGVDA